MNQLPQSQQLPPPSNINPPQYPPPYSQLPPFPYFPAVIHTTTPPDKKEDSERPRGARTRSRYDDDDGSFCYNCGDKDHWANECPKPRRRRFGLSQRGRSRYRRYRSPSAEYDFDDRYRRSPPPRRTSPRRYREERPPRREYYDDHRRYRSSRSSDYDRERTRVNSPPRRDDPPRQNDPPDTPMTAKAKEFEGLIKKSEEVSNLL